MSTSVEPAGGVLNRIAGVWWGAVPGVVARVSRVAAVLAFDGAYLVRWPAVAAAAPSAAAGIGFVLGWLHPPGGEYTYTYSLLTVAVLTAVACWGAGLGLAAWIGFIAGDAILFPHVETDPIGSSCTADPIGASGMCDLPQGLLYIGGPLLISYLVLAQLLLITPLAAATLRTSALGLASRAVRIPTAAAAALHGLLQALLAFLWTQAVPFQVRPIFTWLGDTPEAAAMEPMQATGWVILVVAGAVGTGRALVEARAVRAPGVALRLRSLATRIAGGVPHGHPSRGDTVIGVLMLIALMAGLLTTPVHAGVVLAAVVALMVLRSRVARWSAWTGVLGRIPALVRLGAVAALTYLVARLIFETRAFTDGFETVIAALLVALALFALLIPERQPFASSASSRREAT